MKTVLPIVMAVAHSGKAVSQPLDYLTDENQSVHVSEGVESNELNTQFAAGDSFGVGDSLEPSDTNAARPDGFEPFPTNGLDPIDGNRMHRGVLYVESIPIGQGIEVYTEHYNVCVKAGKRLVVVSNSKYDNIHKNINFMGKGTYKTSYLGQNDFGRLRITLQHYYENKKEHLLLDRIETSSYEFYGHAKRGKDNSHYIRAYFKGIEAYIAEGCEDHLGKY